MGAGGFSFGKPKAKPLANVSAAIKPFIKEEIEKATEEIETYELICKDRECIMDELNLRGDDRVIMNDIIGNLDKQIANILKSGGCASIPTIGNVRKPIQIKVAQDHYHELKVAYKTLPKEDYNKLCRKYYNEVKEEERKARESERKAAIFRKKYYKPYMRLMDKFGQEYADVWLRLHAKVSIIHFDQDREDEWQEYWNGCEE